MIKDLKEHLDSSNETYIQHFKFAACIGILMIFGVIQAIVHAVYPGILTKAASNKIKKLYDLTLARPDNSERN